MNALTLTSVRVQEITGATFRQIDVWARTGILRVGNPTPGSGNSRTWTREALCQAVAYRAASAMWIPPRVTSQLVNPWPQVGSVSMTQGAVSVELDLLAIEREVDEQLAECVAW